MSLNIRLLRNNIKSNPNYGKYFGRVIHYGEVTIDELEARTGIDFFALLPDVVEDELERSPGTGLWR